MKLISVAYYAALREQRGVSQEELETMAETPRELYQELQKAHGLKLDRSLVRAAINGAFADLDHELREGDTLVFIPPVAGG